MAGHRLTSKIAIGVFLGILAAVMVMKVPGIISDFADDRVREHWRSVRNALTPDLVVERCGKPVEERHEIDDSTRYLYYRSSTKGLVVLTFFRSASDNRWSWLMMSDTTKAEGYNIYFNGHSYDLTEDFGTDARMALPCIEGDGKRHK